MKVKVKSNIRYPKAGIVDFKVHLGGFFGQDLVYQCNNRTVEKIGSIEQIKQLIQELLEGLKAGFESNLEFIRAVHSYIHKTA